MYPSGVTSTRAVPAYVAPGDTITQLPIDSISPQGYNLRKLDPHLVEDLKRSIRAVGILQPIMVRPRSEGRFEVVFGNHRLEAARQTGLRSIPGLVRQVTAQEAFLLQVTENIQRNVKMNPIAEARGYKQLIRGGWSIHRIGIYVGKSDSYICDRLRLLDKLAPEVQETLERNANGPISISHAEQLSLIGSKVRQLDLARLIETQRLTVRQLEQIMSKGPSVFCICSKCGRLHRPPSKRKTDTSHFRAKHGSSNTGRAHVLTENTRTSQNDVTISR
jgi:ParB family chromosome partitioning protein